MSKIAFTPKVSKQLVKAQYGIFGHSAVQICGWTKKSFHDKGVCYKEKFYGVDCHRCMEFSPATAVCEQNCIFCWRPMEFMNFSEMDESKVDEPKEIYENLLKKRKLLISGYPGDGMTNMEKYQEALIPNHFAISLSGEPTLYPKLPELVRFLKNLQHTRTIFIVTNGQEPRMLERLGKEDSLPTQLYISVNAPDKELFKKINCPNRKDAWEIFLKSLEVYSKLDTRRIMRMTMIKGMNMDESYVHGYAELIRKATPHFIEIKAYMWLGFSRKRMKNENMPYHEDIVEFAEKIAKETDFEIVDEKRDSRIVLLQNKKEKINRKIS